MFENRKSGWVKSKDEDKEIKKKAEIEASIFKQAEQKQKEADFEDNNRGGYNDNRRGGDRRDNNMS